MNVSRETHISAQNFFTRYAQKLNANIDFSAPFQVSGFNNHSLSVWLLSLYYKTNKNLVVLCEQPEYSEELFTVCYNLLPTSVSYYPDFQKKEDDVPGFSVNSERYRSELINRLDSEWKGLIVTTQHAYESLSIRKKNKSVVGYNLSPEAIINREDLIRSLDDWGYEHVDTTRNPKTYSVRGGLVDVFLLYSSHPVRIEFFGNEIDSMRIYNPVSQRKIESITSLEILPPPQIREKTDNNVSLESYISSNNIILMLSEKASVLCFSGSSDSFEKFEPQNKFFLENQTFLKDEGLIPVVFIEKPSQVSLVEPKVSEESVFVEGITSYSFSSSLLGISCYSASDLLKQTPLLRSRWDIDSIAPTQHSISSILDLEWEDYLVHRDFGIGRFKGLVKNVSRETKQECIKIEYADNGVVYVPIEKFNRVHKLISSGHKEPVLSSLGSVKWQQQKQRVKDASVEVVKSLVEAYKSRSVLRNFKYVKNDEFYHALVASFPYEETKDQGLAIEELMQDLEGDRPVDRLICGDVGFGKTEVALRAIVKAVSTGKKVLFLTPTTILADQHFITAKARLEPLGVGVELLSRFRTKKEQNLVLEKMMSGQVDLVIGTHRLLSDDVIFPDLSLLIIDEEHRFGVRHKEKIRQLKQSLDVITLTATPIPRTLQQSLMGVRSISKIDTPPKTRKPIRTIIKYFNWEHIHKVINNELLRGGQVYFLHNDIVSMPFVLEKLKSTFPEASVALAHGRLASKSLEKIILSFFNKQLDILLCTTIIESGLDVSNANTIIINNAQNFGLSQLYQIRGRVGRGSRQAYCYLLLPEGVTLKQEAYQRLKSIEQYTSLGSGYQIAMKDMEIRGAGNLFGYKQSGHISTVGFELYCQLLKEAVDKKTGNTIENARQPKISSIESALLDENYVELVQDRLYFYHQLAQAAVSSDVENIKDELEDRFGKLPQTADLLIKITELRILLTGSSVSHVLLQHQQSAITITSFAPFSDLESMVNAITDELYPVGFTPKIKSSKDDIKIIIDTQSYNQSFKALDGFVNLFSVH